MPRKVVKYTIREILKWADQHYEWYGRWPTSRSGPIHGTQYTWEGVNTALTKGIGGLKGGDSLIRLLRRKRNIMDSRCKRPDITLAEILEWAQLHHQRTGRWPRETSGRIVHAKDLTWETVDRRLRMGGRNLKATGGLSALLRREFQICDPRGSRILTEEIVLKWARMHKDHTGTWPVTLSGPLINKPDEKWCNIDVAMRNARRGFPYPMSLSQFLRREVGEEAYWRNLGITPPGKGITTTQRKRAAHHRKQRAGV